MLINPRVLCFVGVIVLPFMASLGLTELQTRMRNSIRTGVKTDDFKGIFARSGVSSNEFSLALVGLESYERNVATNDHPMIHDVVVHRLAEMGTTNAVETLTWLFENSRGFRDVGKKLDSFEGLIRIEGLSTNLVSGYSSLMTSTNEFDEHFRINIYHELPSAIHRFSRPDSERLLARDFLLQSVEVETRYVDKLDGAIISLDPTYANSKRRLANLRTVLPRVRLTAQKQYIISAIDALVAYPEANLPD